MSLRTATSCRTLSSRGMRIYTRTGDKGTSGLYSGERLPKSHLVFEALGTNDELTSHLGMSIEFCKAEKNEQLNSLVEQLSKVQSRLQDLNSHIATKDSAKKAHFGKVLAHQHFVYQHKEATRFDLDGSLAKELESWIDGYDAVLPTLNTFILPGGGLPASSLHVARTVCRRAERLVQRLVEEGFTDPPPAIYLNRLSDYLFMSARYATWSMGLKDTIYLKSKST